MKQNLTALTGIRFIAAFYVFLFHTDMRIPFWFLHPRLHSIIRQGAIGVNVFFVLSGFILTYSHYKKEIPYANFIKRRLIRIYPAHFVGLLLCLFVSVPQWKVFILDLLMLESYVPPYANQWYGAAAWSISTEFFFYFLFPLLLPLFLKKSQKRTVQLLALFIVLSSLMGLLQNIYRFDLRISYSFPPARLPEFVSGMMGGLLVFVYGWRAKEWAALVAVVVLCMYFAAIGNKPDGWTIHNVLVVPVTLTVLFACVNPGPSLKWIGSKWMVYLGNISYGFYIVQIPLMLGVDRLLDERILSHSMFWLIPVLLAINLLLSAALYEWVEKPVHRYFTARGAASASKVVVAKSTEVA